MTATKNPALASATRELAVRVVRDGAFEDRLDRVAIEAPLEIRVRGSPLAITMRTPGSDLDLAVGFLLGEGIVRRREDIVMVKHDGQDAVTVELASMAHMPQAARHFYVTSSCGVCGKASIDLVKTTLVHAIVPIDASAHIGKMADAFRSAQTLFEQTGSLHAAGLFRNGTLVRLAEDVGRHNAVDKILGAELMSGHVPLAGHALFLSGRIAFELVQKAALAGIPVVCGIGGPTSLAVDLAEEVGIALYGFVREGRFTRYGHAKESP